MLNRIIFAFLCLCQTQEISSFELGPVPFSYRLTSLKALSCKYIGWACNDCNTLIKCNKNDPVEVSCIEKYPDRPFCDPNLARCVSDSRGCEKIIPDDFQCPDTGVYPDVTNCKRYISCPSKDAIGTTFTCMFDNIFDVRLNLCLSNSICDTPGKECDETNITFAYKFNPNLYVVCQENKKPVLKSCGALNIFYSNENQSCEFTCIEEGIFAHPDDNTLFYACSYNEELELTQAVENCEEGSIFDASLNDCTAINLDDNFDSSTEYSYTSTSVIIDNSSPWGSEFISSSTTEAVVTTNTQSVEEATVTDIFTTGNPNNVTEISPDSTVSFTTEEVATTNSQSVEETTVTDIFTTGNPNNVTEISPDSTVSFTTEEVATTNSQSVEETTVTNIFTTGNPNNVSEIIPDSTVSFTTEEVATTNSQSVKETTVTDIFTTGNPNNVSEISPDSTVSSTTIVNEKDETDEVDEKDSNSSEDSSNSKESQSKEDDNKSGNDSSNESSNLSQS